MSSARSAAAGALALVLAAVLAPASATAQGNPTRPPARPPTAPDTSRARPDTGVRVHGDSITVPTSPATSVKVDSSRALKQESAQRAPVVKADSVKAPTARSEAPALLDANEQFRWNREELFASGALTLLDLLDRVPGLTGFRAGFLAQAEAGAYLGDVGRVRVFMDGLELDALGSRANGTLDLASVQLWSLEDVAVERSARELRVYARTWRTTSVTPYTRVDALTGDQRLTMFRGFYGKRGRHGEVAQFGVQQFGLGDARTPGGSSLGITTRLGWARRGLSIDAYAERVRRDRDAVPFYLDPTNGLAAERGTYTRAYLRAALGDPESGAWLQAVAGTLRYFESSPHSTPAADSTGLDFADTNTSRAQYVLAGGLTRGPARLSVTDRLRAFTGSTFNDVVGRATFDTRFVSLAGYAELSDLDSLSRVELSARFRPIPVISFAGAVARSTPTRGATGSGSTDFRAEGAFRIGRGGSIGGGILVRDSAITRSFALLGQNRAPRAVGRAVGEFVQVRGRVYKSIYADAYGLRWNDAQGLLRPQFETRAQIYLSTRWLGRFPSGNFGVTISAQHEYRSTVIFLAPDGTVVTTAGSRVPGVLLEIRIVSAVLSYQYRNLTRERYQLVPGVLMPPGVNVYGVRWEFFN